MRPRTIQPTCYLRLLSRHPDQAICDGACTGRPDPGAYPNHQRREIAPGGAAAGLLVAGTH